jgi:predicted SAM-dependent methyltransferase
MTTPIRLHIGGKIKHPEWKILDIETRPEVDYICNAKQLDIFENESVNDIYASHVLEHFSYLIDNELITVLQEWMRVLKPNGRLYISVPNINILAKYFTLPNLAINEKIAIMRMIFGGHTNKYDVHKVGFDPDILIHYLKAAGINIHNIKFVDKFNIFEDASRITINGDLISINVIITK